MLTFDSGTTFVYEPACANKDLIVMQDKTSMLYFYGSDLQMTNTGLRLTKGTVCFDQNVTVSCNSNKNLNSSINFLY